MSDFARFVLLEIGMVYFVTMSAIFAPARIVLARNSVLRALLYCPSCVGFWIGAALYLAGFYPFSGHDFVQDIACSAFAGMAVANIWHNWLFHGGNDAFDAEQITQEAPSAETSEEKADGRG